MRTPPKNACGHWADDDYCGSPDEIREYVGGLRCPDHTPARLAGRPEAAPDPALTIEGLRAAAGADPSKPMTPAGPTAIDAKAIASGKRAGDTRAVREARAQLADTPDARARAAEKPTARVPDTIPDGMRDGATFDAAVDMDRLNGQAARVWKALQDGVWRTTRELADLTGDPEPSIGSRFRDFRKPQYGSQPMEARKREGTNTWEYRLAVERLAPTLTTVS